LPNILVLLNQVAKLALETLNCAWAKTDCQSSSFDSIIDGNKLSIQLSTMS